MIDKANVGGTVHDINDTGARGMISPDVFSTAAAYEAGEYCIYNNTLYKFTEAKSAGAWDDSKASATDIASELSALNSRGTYIFKSGNVAAVYKQNVNIATIDLTAGHTYLVLAGADASASVSMTSVIIQPISGTIDRYGLSASRTTGSSGGGCVTWAIVKCQTDGTLAVQGYGFDDAVYNYRGHIVAIRLN